MVASSNPAHERLAQELNEKLQPIVTEQGLFLEEVAVSGTTTSPIVKVFIDLADGPGQLDFDSLEKATGTISQFFDQIDPLPRSYTLEVSTPGADRVLTTPRHWRRSVGLKVRVKTDETDQEIKEILGVITAIDEDQAGATLKLVNGKEIAKESKKDSEGSYHLRFNEVKSAQIELDWSKA